MELGAFPLLISFSAVSNSLSVNDWGTSFSFTVWGRCTNNAFDVSRVFLFVSSVRFIFPNFLHTIVYPLLQMYVFGFSHRSFRALVWSFLNRFCSYFLIACSSLPYFLLFLLALNVFFSFWCISSSNHLFLRSSNRPFSWGFFDSFSIPALLKMWPADPWGSAKPWGLREENSSQNFCYIRYN